MTLRVDFVPRGITMLAAGALLGYVEVPALADSEQDGTRTTGADPDAADAAASKAETGSAQATGRADE